VAAVDSLAEEWMKYTREEATYFYWHCKTAALLIEQLEERNAATSSHIQRAIRMASETAVGKHGVQWASHCANQKKPSSRKDWSGLGLTREHVVPVSVIARRVMEAHESGIEYSWRQIMDDLHQVDLENWRVIDSDHFLSGPAPLSAMIASIVRKSAVLAWITKDEDRRLKKKGLTKQMPPDHQNDDLARYKFCEIQLVPLG
jgi:hypothetical protein